MNHWLWVRLESGTQFPWITPHILKKRFIVPHCLWPSTLPREAKHEGSQTSYFNLSNERGSLPFPIDILIDSLVLEMSDYLARFATRIQHLLFQFCQEGWPVNMARIWATQRPLNSVKPILKLQWHCIRRQLKRSRLHTFITDIHQKCTYTFQDDVQRCDLIYTPGLGLARTAHDCFDRLVYSGLDSLQHYGRPFSRCSNRTLIIKENWKISAMSQTQEAFSLTWWRCILHNGKKMNWWIVPPLMNYVTRFPSGEPPRIARSIWKCTFIKSFDSSPLHVQEMKSTESPPSHFHWRLCVLSSCGVYTLDDH